MGREAICEILATKTVLPEASRAIYSHCAIIDAPKDLRDGDYEVEFAGEVAVTSLHHGAWMVGRILPSTYAEAAAFYGAEAVKAVAPLETTEPLPAVPHSRASRKPAKGFAGPQS
jgi:hypothetical protein